jgi:hypothetical protein
MKIEITEEMKQQAIAAGWAAVRGERPPVAYAVDDPRWVVVAEIDDGTRPYWQNDRVAVPTLLAPSALTLEEKRAWGLGIKHFFRDCRIHANVMRERSHDAALCERQAVVGNLDDSDWARIEAEDCDESDRPRKPWLLTDGFRPAALPNRARGALQTSRACRSMPRTTGASWSH